MIEHWNSYWNEGFITSFGRGFKQNYQGVYQVFWEQIFSDLNNYDNVLDLATGNGGIPLLLLSYLKKNEKQISVTGTDLSSSVSKLNITNLVSAPNLSWDSLTILANIDSADLPFETTSFDLITSQYGFEYSPMANTVKEISRVAKIGASIALVIHHSESFILKRNNSILDCIEQVLTPTGALFHFSNLIKGMGDITNKTQLSLLQLKSSTIHMVTC
jgi:ubiquinone/menaquinone biosynthesis C-methylase UbiE